MTYHMRSLCVCSDWVSQQVEEKRCLMEKEEEEQRLYELKICELDQKAVQLGAAERKTKTAINNAVKRYNQAQVCVCVGGGGGGGGCVGYFFV